ncbi:MAG: hypothetical protein ACHQRJ_11830 [Alphaproteobacteria bacterium]
MGLLTALILLVAAIACVSPLPAAAADVVIFTTGAPNPATVTIAVSDRVTWRNLGSSPRAIAAENNGFPNFALEPEASHSQQFLKVGRYPYQVDGKFDGAVEVTAAGPPLGAGISPKSEKDCSLAILHYDVLVYGYRRYQITFSAGFVPGPGVVTRTAEWTAGWPDLMIGVERCHGPGLPSLTVALVTPDSLNVHHPIRVPGELHGSWDYSDTQAINEHENPPCQFHMDLRVRVSASLQGLSYAQPAGASLSFDGRWWGGEDAPGNRIAPVFAEQCKKRSMRGGGIGEARGNGMPLTPVNGVDFIIDDYILGLSVVKAPPMAFPLDALADGNGFNVDSGTQAIHLYSSHDRAGQVIEEDIVRDRVVVSFSPRK